MKYGIVNKLCIGAVLTLGLCLKASAMDDQFAQLTTNDQAEANIAMKNKSAGEAFLDANRKKPGVVTLPDGLQYKVITEGKGKRPNENDNVTVNYSGTLIDGTEFDSSYKRGQPATFPVSGVIPGWTEALKLMKVGSTWELYIPSSLAYGERGAPPAIGPNETLIFKVNLISIKSS